MVSQIGLRLHLVAVSLLAVEAVGIWGGLIAVSGPFVLIAAGLPGGAYADRWPRERTIVVSEFTRAAVVAAVAVCVIIGFAPLVALAVSVAALASIEGVFEPAVQATVPILAEDGHRLLQANARLDLNRRLALLIAPALAAAAFSISGPGVMLLLDAAYFAVSGLMLVAHPLPPRDDFDAPVMPFGKDVGSSVRSALDHVLLKWSLVQLGAWDVSAGMVFGVGFAVLAKDVLKGGPGGLALLLGAYGAGNLLGTAFTALRPPRRVVPALFGGALVYAIGIALAGAAHTLELAALCAALAALGGPVTDLTQLTLIQSDFPGSVGGVCGLRATVAHATHGLGLLTAGPLMIWLGVRAAMVSGAAVTFVVAVYCLYRFVRATSHQGSVPVRGEPQTSSRRSSSRAGR